MRLTNFLIVKQSFDEIPSAGYKTVLPVHILRSKQEGNLAMVQPTITHTWQHTAGLGLAMILPNKQFVYCFIAESWEFLFLVLECQFIPLIKLPLFLGNMIMTFTYWQVHVNEIIEYQKNELKLKFTQYQSRQVEQETRS